MIIITLIVIIAFIVYLLLIGLFSLPLIVYIKSLFFEKEERHSKTGIIGKVQLETKSEPTKEEINLSEDSTFSEEIGQENSAIIDMQDEEEEWD